MNSRSDEIHIDKQDARAGRTTGVVRYILAASLGLAVVAMIVVMAGWAA